MEHRIYVYYPVQIEKLKRIYVCTRFLRISVSQRFIFRTSVLHFDEFDNIDRYVSRKIYSRHMNDIHSVNL